MINNLFNYIKIFLTYFKNNNFFLLLIIFLTFIFKFNWTGLHSSCDASVIYQMDFQEAATPSMEGIINFNHSVSFIIIFIMGFVSWLLFNAIFYYCEDNNTSPSKFTHSNELEIVWTSVPAIILLFLATPSFSLLYSMDEIADATISMKIIGHQWYWSYELSNDHTNFDTSLFQEQMDVNLKYDCYMTDFENMPEKQGYFRLLETNKRVLLPTKTHIKLFVSSADVLHSWTVPSFGIKVDACPGRLNQLNLFIKRSGLFFGQCSEICGVNHAFMPIAVVGVDADLYEHHMTDILYKRTERDNWVNIKIWLLIIEWFTRPEVYFTGYVDPETGLIEIIPDKSVDPLTGLKKVPILDSDIVDSSVNESFNSEREKLKQSKLKQYNGIKNLIKLAEEYDSSAWSNPECKGLYDQFKRIVLNIEKELSELNALPEQPISKTFFLNDDTKIRRVNLKRRG